MPISFSDESTPYIDGIVLNSFETSQGGQVIIIEEVMQKTLYLDEPVTILENSLYRFYEPVGSDKEGSMIKISGFRELS